MQITHQTAELDRYKELVVAVIMQAITDSRQQGCKGGKPLSLKARIDERTAQEFLSGATGMLNWWCQWIDIDPQVIVERCGDAEGET